MSDTATPTLQQLQLWMQGVLINPLGDTKQEPHTHLPPQLQQGAVEAVVRSSKRLSAREHLELYQRSYLWRLRECMAQQFPALKHALGDELFRGFADQYLQLYPPTSYTLATLGQRFPDFLQETRPDKNTAQKESWPDFMIQLAQFEFAIALLFDTHEPLQEDHEDMSLAPLTLLFQHSFPVLAYYRAAIADKKPELPLPFQTYGLIVRKDYQLALLDLQPAQYQLLSGMKKGLSFSAAKQGIINGGVDQEELSAVLPQWLARWKEFGVLRVGKAQPRYNRASSART